MKPLLVSALALLMLCPVQLHAHNNQSQVSQSFKTFWMKLKTAVAANDREAVASMTKLPFLFDNQDLNREGFIKRYDEIIDRKARRCFAREKPLREQESYEIFCGQMIYYFSQDNGEWKFVSIGVND
jgi:hypothetical protein